MDERELVTQIIINKINGFPCDSEWIELVQKLHSMPSCKFGTLQSIPEWYEKSFGSSISLNDFKLLSAFSFVKRKQFEMVLTALLTNNLMNRLLLLCDNYNKCLSRLLSRLFTNYPLDYIAHF